MAFEFKLPDIGEGIHEGEIVKWFFKEGDEVKEDDSLCEVQNDKAVVEIPSPVEGTVKKLHVAEDEVAIVGNTLITFDAPGYESHGASNVINVSPTMATSPSATCSFFTVPSTGDGISTTALSFWTSHRESSSFTSSPSSKNHLTISPSWIPSPISGNLNSNAINTTSRLHF